MSVFRAVHTLDSEEDVVDLSNDAAPATSATDRVLGDSSDSDDEDDLAEPCVICQDPLGTDLMALPCGHVFHQKCISTWLRRGDQRCPLCKKPSRRNQAVSLFLEPRKVAQQIIAKLGNSGAADTLVAQEKAREAKRQLEEAKEKTEAAEKALKQKQTQVETLLRQQSSTESHIEQLRQQVNRARTKSEKLEKELGEAQEDVERLQRNAQLLVQKMALAEPVLELMQGNDAEYEQLMRDNKSQPPARQVKQLEVQVTWLRREFRRLTREQARWKQSQPTTVTASAEEVQRLRWQLKRSRAECVRLRQQLQSPHSANGAAAARNDSRPPKRRRVSHNSDRNNTDANSNSNNNNDNSNNSNNDNDNDDDPLYDLLGLNDSGKNNQSDNRSNQSNNNTVQSSSNRNNDNNPPAPRVRGRRNPMELSFDIDLTSDTDSLVDLTNETAASTEGTTSSGNAAPPVPLLRRTSGNKSGRGGSFGSHRSRADRMRLLSRI
ncbi:MAG: hypothetical protein MHM6MM_003855 [Cercozoa sp. M6MM]